MTYPPSNENTDSSEPVSFQNTYPPDRNTIEDMIVSTMWAPLDTSYSSIQYTLSTSILHSLNIPPNTAINEENMYRNTSDPSNDAFLSFSRMVIIIGIMRNDNLLKLVWWIVAYIWRYNHSLHNNSHIHYPNKCTFYRFDKDLSTNEIVSQLLQIHSIEDKYK